MLFYSKKNSYGNRNLGRDGSNMEITIPSSSILLQSFVDGKTRLKVLWMGMITGFGIRISLRQWRFNVLRPCIQLRMAKTHQRPTKICFPPIVHHEYQKLASACTKKEVYTTLTKMDSYKAPGIDGFYAGFFQKIWGVIGNSIWQFSSCFLSMGVLPESLNETLLVLIPKVPNPERLTQYRPISLCTVLYKLLTKTLVNRLKSIFNVLVDPTQCSFIPGRQTNDNIIIL